MVQFLSGVMMDCVHIALGGSSDIYKASLCRPGRKPVVVAIKVKRASGEERTRSLEPEGEMWAKVGHHPNIVPLSGIYLFRGSIALVSPWYELGHIMQFLEKYPCTPPIPLLEEIAAGVVWLHSIGLAHGDIKPPNIMINGERHACLTDFGITQPLTGGKTGSNSVTYRYIAPEWVDQLHFTTATDVWAFGFAALEILTGRKPFPSLRGIAVVCKVSQDGRPQRINYSSIPANVWEFLQSTWNADPFARPSAQGIERFFAQLPENERRFVSSSRLTSRSRTATPHTTT